MSLSKGQRTKENILVQALTLYSEKGAHNVPFQDIADKVGITQAALYKYFKDRDDLLGAAILLGAEKGREFFNATQPANSNAQESLVFNLSKNLEWCVKGSPFTYAFLSLHFYATQIPHIHKIRRDITKVRLKRLEDYLEQGNNEKLWYVKDRKRTALVINNLLLGEMMEIINAPKTESLKERQHRVCENVLALIGAKPI
ncbi:TetR/AcrR family transcriptional regulator [Bdellovibrio bacteriovorus]|uniref:TetR/AcrR family transcriptional regulator n=1 Tax=Bdellovibrio bacteriovorus TaxID=959 RepID=UPI0035A901A5